MDLAAPSRAALTLLLAAALASCSSATHHSSASSADEQPLFRTPSASPSVSASVGSAVPTAPADASPTSAGSAPARRASAAPTRTTTTKAAAPAPTTAARAYRFVPAPAASGPTPTAVVSVADLATTPGRQLTVDVTQAKPGAIYLNSYTATSAAAMPGLRACVRQQSGPACTPVAVPDPAYWAVTAADVARTTQYELVLAVAGSTTTLMGVHVGWDGPHTAAVHGLRVPGGCATGGYKPGCGVRAHVDLGAGGPVTLASATSGLHVTIKDKTANTKLASQVLRGSITTTVPAGHEWSMHLRSDNGSPVASLSLTVTWP